MSLAERLVKRSDRFYDSLRRPEAFETASRPGTAEDFSALEGHKYCLLVTFRRSGEAVPTPVWFGLDGQCVYVSTREANAKVKRIRRSPHARVGPCSLRGRPLGPLTESSARVVGPEEEGRAETALRANYGLGRRLYEAVVEWRGLKTVYLEMEPAGGTA